MADWTNRKNRLSSLNNGPSSLPNSLKILYNPLGNQHITKINTTRTQAVVPFLPAWRDVFRLCLLLALLLLEEVSVTLALSIVLTRRCCFLISNTILRFATNSTATGRVTSENIRHVLKIRSAYKAWCWGSLIHQTKRLSVKIMGNVHTNERIEMTFFTLIFALYLRGLITAVYLS